MKSNFKIMTEDEYFSKENNQLISNWPVVYLLKNNKEIYIGETTNVYMRFIAHSKSEEKSKLNERYIIHHDYSNRSVIYFIESDLINNAFADKTYNVINRKMQSNVVLSGHDFYEKEKIIAELPDIWEQLRKMGIFNKTYLEIEDEELFKYSPWKEFDENQIDVIDKVSDSVVLNEKHFVSGGAGTGKTLLIIRSAMNASLNNKNIKIGIFSAKTGNHLTFSRVISSLAPYFKKRIKILSSIKDEDLSKIDYLLVDEAQRLRKFNGNSFSSPEYFKNGSVKNEIEQIKSKNIKYTLFYDPYQSFHDKDIGILNYIDKKNKSELYGQYRMSAGDDYLLFLKEFLQIGSEKPKDSYNFGDFDFSHFESEELLYDKVLIMNNDNDKSRLLTSLNYDKRKWITQNLFKTKESSKIKDYSNIETDFKIGKYKLVWNKNFYYNDWLNKSSVDEVGCVHTVQGRDFNYVGVIMIDDIKFVNGKIVTSDEVKYSYYILLTRGIIGMGLHIKDKGLRNRFNEMLQKKIKDS